MASKLQKQLKMSKPFENIETEAYINLMRTHSVLTAQANEVFKSMGITQVQYNVLRILKGAGPEGLPTTSISERMITREPDITRLVDRLLKLEWVDKRRCTEDRRVVYVSITKKGMELIQGLHKTLDEFHVSLFKHMSKKDLNALNDLLVAARNEA
ncbi:MAG: MarR family winged helix-turn-helix transcriptional regulator [Planctomycetota bacterium]